MKKKSEIVFLFIYFYAFKAVSSAASMSHITKNLY